MSESQIAVSPMQWAPLKDIDDVAPLDVSDQACLKDLYEVLKRHGKVERFGVMLVHKHFDMEDDETLLEFCDPTTKTLTIRTVKTNSTDLARSVQTSWLLRENDSHEVVTECWSNCWKNVHGNHESTHRS